MQTDLAQLRQKPIPNMAELRERRVGYRTHPIDTASPHFAEPLVDAETLGLLGRNHYYWPDNPPYYQSIPGAIKNLYVRQTVAEKLLAVDKKLAGWGMRLFLFDAFRPRAVQVYFHHDWMPRQIRQRHPDWDEAQVARATEAYWAAPTDSPNSPAPHETGAAVDVTLVAMAGGMMRDLYMGSIFDDVSLVAHPDYFENQPAVDDALSQAEAAANRRLLHWVMMEAGFAPHPNEWWHFSWGDQLWGRLHGHRSAHYGLATIAE